MTEVCDVQQPAATPQSSPVEIVRALGGGALLYMLYSLVITTLNVASPLLPLPVLCWVCIGCASTVAYLLLVLYTIRFITRLTLTVRQEVICLIVSLLLFLALNPVVWEAVRLIQHGVGFWQVFAELTSPDSHPLVEAIVPFFLIATGTFFGRLVARIIREHAMLVPVGIIAGLIDFWGVYWGPVSVMSENAPMAVSGLGSAASVAASVPDTAMESLSGPLAIIAHITPPEAIGIGDFVFLAFFLTSAYRLGFSAKRTMWGIFAGLLLASAIMALDGHVLFGREMSISYLPGLLFICGGVLLANLRAWKLTRREWAMTGVIVALLGILIGISIARAEQNGPQRHMTQYTLTATSGSTALRGALARVQKHTPGAMVSIVVQAMYRRDTHGIHMVQWAVLSIHRQPEVTLNHTWESQIIGVEQRMGRWQVKQLSVCPPANAVLYLAPPKQTADVLTLIRQAKGIPPSAFGLLDHPEQFAASVTGHKDFFIELRPEAGQIIDPKGTVLKRLTYP